MTPTMNPILPSHPGMISTNFSWYEVQHSDTAERLGIDNSVPQNLVPAAENTAVMMEIVRSLIGHPIKVNSWFRCYKLQALPEFYNPTSQHPKAEAVDWVCPVFGEPIDICKFLLNQPEMPPFDQMIMEHTWIHLSFNSIPGSTQRMQVLSLLENKKYAKGLTDIQGNPL